VLKFIEENHILSNKINCPLWAAKMVFTDILFMRRSLMDEFGIHDLTSFFTNSLKASESEKEIFKNSLYSGVSTGGSPSL